MRNIRLLIEYDGTAYQGWQVQKKGLTIQGIIEDRILKITGKQSRVIGASRTDAGVHALGQVATFKTASTLDTEIIKRALNALLPWDIRILEASECDDSFHPRKSAKRKSYFYIISNQKEPRAFLHRYTCIVQQPLELRSMIEAAKMLIGRHNFSSFRGAGCSSKNPFREVFSLSIEKFESLNFMTVNMKGEFLKICIEANGFLRHMVRNIVGTLIEIGRGKLCAEKIKEILESHDRRLAGPTAPPNGLFLERITY